MILRWVILNDGKPGDQTAGLFRIARRPSSSRVNRSVRAAAADSGDYPAQTDVHTPLN
jgi:hypothetical protein